LLLTARTVHRVRVGMMSIAVEVERFTATECLAFDEDAGEEYEHLAIRYIEGQITIDAMAQLILENVRSQEEANGVAPDQQTSELVVNVITTITGEAKVQR